MKFCKNIRKFNLCLWLLSLMMRRTTPSNVNCTLQKNNAVIKRFIDQRHYDMDPHSIVYVKAGYNEPTELLPVPTSSWIRDSDMLKIGEYAYDNLSSADFVVGDFPFHEFIQHTSGKSSYDMITGIKEFYHDLPESSDAPVSDGRMT